MHGSCKCKAVCVRLFVIYHRVVHQMRIIQITTCRLLPHIQLGLKLRRHLNIGSPIQVHSLRSIEGAFHRSLHLASIAGAFTRPTYLLSFLLVTQQDFLADEAAHSPDLVTVCVKMILSNQWSRCTLGSHGATLGRLRAQ